MKVKAGMSVDENGGSFFPVISEERTNYVHRLYVNGPIVDVSDFLLHVETLDKCKEGDIVKIFLSSPGGCLYSTEAMLHAIRTAMNNGVIVHCVATGRVASAGTLILLECGSFELSNNFAMLVHNGSIGDFGDTNKFKSSVAFNIEQMEKTLRSAYEGFMTEKEISDMLDGKDFWFDAQQFVDRFQQREKYFEKKLKQEAEPVKKPRSKKEIPLSDYNPEDVAFKNPPAL